MVAWNQGDFTLAWDQRGTFSVSRGTEGQLVKLNVQTLTALLMGYKRPSYLQQIERLSSSPETVKLLELMIHQEEPYFSDYF